MMWNRLKLIRPGMVLLMLSLAGLACNVQFGGPETPTPLATPEGAVVFIAPANNSVIAEGSPIILAVRAADAGAGVARIEFALDSVVIGSQTAPNLAGQPTFTARMNWVAAGVQGHLLTAEAFRADGGRIGEASVTIEVVTRPPALTGIAVAPTGTLQPRITLTVPALAQTEPTSTPTLFIPTPVSAIASETPTFAPVFSVPTSEPGGAILISPTPPPQVAIVQPTSALPAPILEVTFDYLNVREGPGTTYKEIGRIPRGEKAEIIGRNADRAWVVVVWGQVRGWVTTNPNFSVITGDTSNLPLVASPEQAGSATPSGAQAAQTPPPTPGVSSGEQGPVVAPGPDLVVKRYLVSPVNASTFLVTVVIENRGTTDAPQSLLIGIFQPGDERVTMPVPLLRAGYEITLPPMTVTLKQQVQALTGMLMADGNNEVNEGESGEKNNTLAITN